jgi:hypothetical protein
MVATLLSRPLFPFRKDEIQMKYAAKTLGVAALGAAFAASAAGSASAASALPDAGSALDGVTRTLPTERLTPELPSDAAKSATTGHNALGAVKQAAPTVLGAAKTADPLSPATGLLGGLPVNGLAQGGLPINGLGG